MCVLGISDLTAASTYDVAVGMKHVRKSASVCINNTNGKLLSSVNPHVSTICLAQWKHWHVVCVELRFAGRLESFCRIVCDCWTLAGIGYTLGLYETERDRVSASTRGMNSCSGGRCIVIPDAPWLHIFGELAVPHNIVAVARYSKGCFTLNVEFFSFFGSVCGGC